MNVVVLCGGVGAARFLLGIQSLARTDETLHVTAIVNTGDDDNFYGVHVCPDIDSILYHLADLHDEERGWGQRNETFTLVEQMRLRGEDAWFNLGDRDMAMNIIRTQNLQAGMSLRDVTRDLCVRLGINEIDVMPMCEERVATIITTKDDRTLSLQEYFVRERCAPEIATIEYKGAPQKYSTDVREALNASDVVIIAPSNPYLSIFPLLAIDELNTWIREHKDKVIAISPIVSGQAIKGPLAAIMKSHHREISPVGIAEIYCEYAQQLVLDEKDEQSVPTIEMLGMTAHTTNTIMDSETSRSELAQYVLEYAYPS